MDGMAGFDRKIDEVVSQIGQLKIRLLDLTRTNPLISFSHARATGSRTHARFIDLTLEDLHASLVGGTEIAIISLPPTGDEPLDEKTEHFKRALEIARRTDVDYLAAAAKLTDSDITSPVGAKIERALRNRVRQDLDLPPCKVTANTGLAEYSSSLGIDPSFDLPPCDPDSAPASVTSARVLMLPDTMERTLSKLRDAARTAVEDMGVNTLHLVFGFLEWFESDASDKPLLSPLLLLRVELDRRLVRSRYTYNVCGSGEELQPNLALSERLDRDFRTKLPTLAAEESLSSYLRKVETDICQGRKGWRVRRFSTLAHFSFARIAMFNDLNEQGWQAKGGLARQPVLNGLLTGGDGADPIFAEEYDVDSTAVQSTVPILVLEADCSQHSAVHDAMNGRDLVIEGPPGTGKSQTITNIIAAALANGKRVLFVAEKQAALQVVKDRMDKVGLGDFCLELHSGKARKKEVVDALYNRLIRRTNVLSVTGFDDKRRELASTKNELTRHVQLLNATIGACGASVHDILWGDRVRRLDGDGAKVVDAISLASVEELTDDRIKRLHEALSRFERAAEPILTEFSEVSSHPWYGIRAHSVSPSELESIRSRTYDVGKLFKFVKQECSDFASNHAFLPQAFGEIVDFLTSFATLSCHKRLPGQWLTALLPTQVRTQVKEWLDSRDSYVAALHNLQRLGVRAYKATASDMAKQLDVAWGVISRGAVSRRHFGDLSGLLSEFEAVREETLLFEAEALRAAQVLRVEPPLSVADVRTLIMAFECVVCADDSVTSGVWQAAMEPAASNFLRRLDREAGELRVRAAELGNDLSMASLPSSTALRQHAAALKSAGIFGFVKRSVRIARSVFIDCSVSAIKKRDAEIASIFLLVADFKDAVSAFDSSAGRLGVYGPNFDSLHTDSASALAASEWAADVRKKLAGLDGIAASARKALLTADAEHLNAVTSYAKSKGFRLLTRFVSGLSEDANVSDIIKTARARIDCLKDLLDIAKALDVDESTDLLHIQEICGAIKNADDLAGKAESPNWLPDDFRDIVSKGHDVHASIRYALDFADAFTLLPIDTSCLRSVAERGHDYLADQIIPAAKAIASTMLAGRDQWKSIRELLEVEEATFFGGLFVESTPEKIALALLHAASYEAGLGGWISYLLERHNVQELGLGGLLHVWDARSLDLPLAQLLDCVYYRSLARLALRRAPELERFTGVGIEAVRARYKRLDEEEVSLGRQLLAAKLAEKPVPMGSNPGPKSELTDRLLIEHQHSLRIRHIAVRQLLSRAGSAIQALKPCFMMSPLSVAQFLKPGSLEFDLLVIDEASQMRPEDALGSAARCKQIVVVGDPKQLPPTSFFDRSDEALDEELGEEVIDSESILDLAVSVFRPARRLRWHYRSRHGSLIAFSNKEFYDDDLVVFPSPGSGGSVQGVASVRVNGLYKNRTNVCEVEEICQAAATFMLEHSDMSLGIVALNQVQRELIVLEMDRLATTSESVQAYREKWENGLERFFVKNLENVQGDERDVIFISTVFGPPEPNGKVRQNFGPINGKAGHRRLNVLFTRAKHHVRVFTSMSPDDVVAGPDSPRGAKVLKAYLAYAATGQLHAGEETGRECDSDFEVFVRDRLLAEGYRVAPQVGVAGFFIDLGVRDPDISGAFLLGIECDGASYHSSKSARDRDVLRQQVLEGLGWVIYRIWSTDWFRDPVGQTRKLVDFIEQTRRSKHQPMLAAVS